ncbi:ribonuclease HII [Candidatus Giovannonibacteria bacterium RIFCSPLOWO2_02_FULL_43_11b]|uniref:Ribonuclease HII n=1 Tax=Candidatus Giovannonibacteria bacterium RIFCSPHIGHO2_12_FULL_43_15 TaxID=1798341 RepID=A0A1F5WR48_9BACT|nr:MAG: ribonuclease HII [Candidatus Giovannonibacteria bacterium RIFCSPHIGHO2_01_FULL_43_100]OGF66362.1 MAG: ribonuclease HII [Candidatus Giovannonibacteria bacterium RIFCSPHIGHO2_02_FULL_43_32]OGF77721.1 MAG: ribonuclease HII [Candidatus Giovannonibacteria bacterium RIFCSPHIGHO2_12_FULL_43_15]OGF78062.1 MAG: ribonuclease HII [Candidatus Giovannonibacteria bacterium RIFCSPLOWO2_01_FULL_43_60]OGF89327.1 MAG: ribonuclease HII [Candidatus Giovannonibacteria bacterium RIFCSPLOWO2_02_FULL_43_11b]O
MSKYIVGIDEAGRGPLAGPVTVAVVAILKNSKIKLPDRDSKKLSAKKREEWFQFFKDNPLLKYSVSSVSHSIIDKRGISYALRLAVRRSIEKLEFRPKMILLDGSLFAPQEYNQKTIIKGDEKIPIIAAASIVAKVTRDRKMVRLAKKYPKYGFEMHKGYGTLTHRVMLKKYGLCEIHRKSFCTRLI